MSTIERSPTVSEVQEHLVDLTITRYVDWRGECAAVVALYHDWCTAGRGARSDAFHVYRSALEREERLARLYAGAVAQLEQMLWPERQLASMSRSKA